MYNNEIHFSQLPTVDAPRSIFDLSFNISTTFNFGQLIPLGAPIEVLPGDTFNLKSKVVARLSSAYKVPVMDNAFVDISGFYVPWRLTWVHLKEFFGETSDPWDDSIQYQMPYLTAPSGGWSTKSIAAYFGIRPLTSNLKVRRLEFNGYCQIWNDWFRDENVMYATTIDKSDNNLTGSNGTNYVTDASLGGAPLPVSRHHDMFSSALPFAQRGPAVTLSLGSIAPVITGSTNISNPTTNVLKWLKTNGNNFSNGDYNLVASRSGSGPDINSAAVGLSSSPGSSDSVLPGNLYADLSNATASTINKLREEFALQHFYEISALYGNRYTEFIRGHFGIISPDARIQRSEFLFMHKVPIQVNTIAQTAPDSTSGTSTQGIAKLAAYGVTGYENDSFIESFTEHGFIYLLACARTQRTYQQGVPRQFLKRDVEEIYVPAFSNLGNIPVKNAEIYAQGTSADDGVFGFQEAWYEYRFIPNRVSGEFYSVATNPLDFYHYADDYSTLPTLSAGWMAEGTAQVDRTLQVTSAVNDQLLLNCNFLIKATREMPMYSLPKLKG